MSKVRIPPVLRQGTDGQREVEVGGATVGEVLRDLAVRYPSVESQIFQDGELARYVNVYLNDQDVQYLQRLDTPVADTDTVIILPAMAGGAPRGDHPR